jgi:hypothetical protein
VCSSCFSFVNKIVKFSERCDRANQFLIYLENLADSTDLEAAKKEFGLADDKADRSTDTVDLQLGIKDEFIDSQNQGLLKELNEK